MLYNCLSLLREKKTKRTWNYWDVHLVYDGNVGWHTTKGLFLNPNQDFICFYSTTSFYNVHHLGNVLLGYSELLFIHYAFVFLIETTSYIWIITYYAFLTKYCWWTLFWAYSTSFYCYSPVWAPPSNHYSLSIVSVKGFIDIHSFSHDPGCYFVYVSERSRCRLASHGRPFSWKTLIYINSLR